MVEKSGQAGDFWKTEINGKHVRFPSSPFLNSYEHLRSTGADVYLADYIEAVVRFLVANYEDLPEMRLLCSRVFVKKPLEATKCVPYEFFQLRKLCRIYVSII